MSADVKVWCRSGRPAQGPPLAPGPLYATQPKEDGLEGHPVPRNATRAPPGDALEHADIVSVDPAEGNPVSSASQEVEESPPPLIAMLTLAGADASAALTSLHPSERALNVLLPLLPSAALQPLGHPVDRTLEKSEVMLPPPGPPGSSICSVACRLPPPSPPLHPHVASTGATSVLLGVYDAVGVWLGVVLLVGVIVPVMLALAPRECVAVEGGVGVPLPLGERRVPEVVGDMVAVSDIEAAADVVVGDIVAVSEGVPLPPSDCELREGVGVPDGSDE